MDGTYGWCLSPNVVAVPTPPLGSAAGTVVTVAVAGARRCARRTAVVDQRCVRRPSPARTGQNPRCPYSRVPMAPCSCSRAGANTSMSFIPIGIFLPFFLDFPTIVEFSLSVLTTQKS